MTDPVPDNAAPDAAAPRELLQRHFGFREFLEGQEAVVQALLAGEDALVIMPTGGGKSLCYQLPALALEGLTVVVSPLIALMKDQVDGLARKNIPTAFINSSLDPPELEERIARMVRGEYRIVYIAPERFRSARFVAALAPLSIALFAIDEAHCISQWGHDFRPDYLRLRGALRELGEPPVAALTATATPEVRADIVEQLGLGRAGRRPPRVFVSGFARRNLTLAVTPASDREDKIARILEILQGCPTGIVYCATRKNVERTAGDLAEAGVRCVAYHAGMTEEQRTKAQERFMGGKVGVAAATNAFGMGVDRADVRCVIHHDIPGSVEAYYQEAGRAGRDGEPARCELLYSYADVRTQEFFIEGSNPARETIEAVYEAVARLCRRGPIEMPVSEIAEHVAWAGNDMAVGTSLHLLERAGAIRREHRGGSRIYTTHLVAPDRPFADLPLDFPRLAEKRERDFAKLRRMIDYAERDGCRHRTILAYFGDPEAARGGDAGAEALCGACDACLDRAEAGTRLPTEEELVVVQKALSCVARVDGRYGRGRIAQTLAGSRSKEVLDAGLDRLPTYGLLSDLGEGTARTVLDALVAAGCLDVRPGQYPTLSLTELGDDVMRRRKAIPLALPKLPAARAGEPLDAAGRRPGSRGAEAREERVAEEGPYDETVFEALRTWRREEADARGVPAYIVYPDRTLRELARRLPKNIEELLTVRGIGHAKAGQFGRETLEVIRKIYAARKS